MSSNAVLFHSIAFLKCMFVWSGRSIPFTITTIAVDPLNCVISAPIITRWIGWNTTITRPEHSKPSRQLLILYRSSGLPWRKETVALRPFNTTASHIFAHHCSRSREVLCDFDLDIAKVPFPSLTFPFFLVWVLRFWSPRRAPFEPTIPIVRHKWFALVALSRPMRIYVVHMRKICQKSREGWQLVIRCEQRESSDHTRLLLR